MSSFGVTAVRWNSELTEISDCMVHVVEKLSDGRVMLTGGTSYPAQDLASIIAGGERAWVVSANDAGNHGDSRATAGTRPWRTPLYLAGVHSVRPSDLLNRRARLTPRTRRLALPPHSSR
jgi:hypothetical protein